jgi:hypothetical protein
MSWLDNLSRGRLIVGTGLGSAYKDVGVRNLLLNVNVGQMAPGQVERWMRLFGEQVLPMFRA